MPLVYVNGQEAGRWDYGYMSFRVDATSFVHFGQPNVVAVHVDTRQHQSRWYPGAGIYRKVQLVISDPVSIAHWGTFVTTPEVIDASATVRVRTMVENHRDRAATVKLESVLVDPDGRQVGKQPASYTLAERGTHEFGQTLRITRPELWDVRLPGCTRS